MRQGQAMKAAAHATPTRVVLIDKPSSWTSFDVIRALRPVLGRKLGHCGTLDPFATGLLLIVAGQATRVSDLLMDLPKEYVVRAKFGVVSSTHDAAGELTVVGGHVEEQQVRRALEVFRGRIVQKIPLTSAVKVNGEPLYRKAHRGETYDTPEREVTIYDFILEGFDENAQEALLRARVSKGTYVRTLVHDLGHHLGTGAYASELRRVRIGRFDVVDAISPEQVAEHVSRQPLDSRAVLSLSEALRFLPRYYVRGVDERRVRHGNELMGTPQGLMCVFGAEGLLAVYEGWGGVARAKIVFPEPQR